MALLLALVFLGAVPAAVAAALAGLLAMRRPDWALVQRTALAAAGAGLAPVILPIISVLRGNDGGVGPVVPTIALLLLALVMAVLVGVPVALWIGKRKAPAAPSARTFD